MFDRIKNLDWSNLEDVSVETSILLRQLASNKEYLKSLLQIVENDSNLFSMCESYDVLDKIVLYNYEDKFRIRLHFFLNPHIDRPHNHRWSYSSLILHGQYKHLIYDSISNFSITTKSDEIKPVFIQNIQSNSVYTLEHRMVHSIIAEANTVSLVIRGPAEKNEFVVMDKLTNVAWIQYGQNFESVEEKMRKRMTVERFKFLLGKLFEFKII